MILDLAKDSQIWYQKQQKEKDKLYFIKIKNWECSKNKNADVTEIIGMF